MHTSILKININDLKKNLDNKYFFYKDLFYRVLIANICVHKYIYGKDLRYVLIDDAEYNQLLTVTLNKQPSLSNLFIDLNLTNHLNVYITISLYLDEFIQKLHNNDKLNLYGIRIEDNGFLLVSNKKLRKENLNV